MSRKNKLDEMQEQILLKVEGTGLWIALLRLFAALIVQAIIGGGNLWRNVIDEWILFICLAGYIVIGSIKNGIWSRRLEPTLKSTVFTGIIAGIICGVIIFLMAYIKNLGVLIALSKGMASFALASSISFIALGIASFVYNVYKNRQF